MSTLEDTEIHVRLEDQKKINLFARKTTYLNDLKVQIKDAKKKLQNVEDASDDLELLDDDEVIGYKIGEVFIDHPIEHTQTLLGELKNDLCQRIKDLEGNVTQIETLLKDLKVQLYAKFGDNINLED